MQQGWCQDRLETADSRSNRFKTGVLKILVGGRKKSASEVLNRLLC